ncbi:EndoU domain-containing protein [Fulvivirga sp. 29W222]|uniref:EndoU domain-containing protein n=1 Tax=Fulvivirga marina TaxID=2494733 RepID=A0A937G0N0_9BACT|nr:RHS repeat-associated core domain-containing protein [Fulvivirga marina]MBL6449635.1 EndoU domain-containing protein [Fulvivirga marina]
MSSLTGLSHLYLGYNTLLTPGPLPAWIGNNTSLAYLHLQSMNRTGEIPPSYSGLTNLVQIFLNNNQLEGTIPAWVGGCTGLKHLVLAYNRFSGTLPDALQNLSNLEVMNLTANDLEGTLPSWLGNLTQVFNLSFDSNNFVGPVPESLVNLNKLIYLFLHSNSFTGFPDFTGHPNLGRMDVRIQENYISQEDIDINRPGGVNIFRLFFYSPQKTPNGIVGDEVELQALRDLYQSTGGPGWADQTGWPTDWSTITSVDQIVGWHGISVENGDIVEIDLNNNNLTNNLPALLNDLKSLRALYLHHNQLSGPLPDLSGLDKLEVLYLSNNPLGISTPTWITNLTSLTHLAIENSQLTGTIPSDIGNLTNLELLVLRSNQLTGTLPPSINQLSGLVTLRVDVNQLSGPLPDMSPLLALEMLDLNRNNFTGPIPDWMGLLTSMKYLRIWNNPFTGTIPASLGTLNQLEQLIIGGCLLTGTVPQEVTNLPNLRYLTLTDNQLEGDIPPFPTTSKLQELKIAGNKITGLPDLKVLPNLVKVHADENIIPLQDIETQFTAPDTCLFTFTYANQAFAAAANQNIPFGQILEINTDDFSVNNNYQWEKEENGNWININGQNQSSEPGIFTIDKVRPEASGNYRYTITNSIVTDLTMIGGPIAIEVIITAPDATIALVADFDKIQLEWEGVEDIVYEIERSLTPGSGYSLIATTVPGASAYKDHPLNANTTYYYRLRSVYGNDQSPYSAEIQATTKTPVPTNNTIVHKPQYNGNISAIKWKTQGDGEEKLYTYDYDPMNRITSAQYAQGSTATNTWTSAQGGYSVNNINYDLNGNIQSLNRQSIEEDLRTIDALTYSYANGGNQLTAVSDAAGWEGFADKNTTGDDYEYDANGNMTKDKNKGITITYNHLNLPVRVEKDANNYIIYHYDATGAKQEQIVYEEGKAPKSTRYFGELIYEDGELTMIQHEEGRLVKDETTGNWDYQYHLKDHLGNTRLTFTTKPKTINFSLNYENDEYNQDDIGLFENVETISNVRDFNHTDGLYGGPLGKRPYTHSQVLYSSPNPQVGSVIAIPVMAGDKITASVHAKYVSNSANSNVGVNTLASALIGAFTGGNPGTSEHGISTINNNFGSEGLIGGVDFPYEDADAPKAFLNAMFLPDGETINLVKDATFAYDQIDKKYNENVIDGISQDPFDLLMLKGFEASQNGYILVYLSNEGSLTDVYFDDLEIELIESPVVQVDDYYPFGLQFNSYQRVTAKKNRFLYNEGTERIDDLDLGLDMTPFRMYDPALGRWWQIDPIEKYHESGYAWVTNNPILFNDPFGLDTLNTTDSNFDPKNINDDDVVIGPNVLNEVVVQGEQMSEEEASNYDKEEINKYFFNKGDKVLGKRDGVDILNWVAGPREQDGYLVDDDGYIIGAAPTLAIYEGPSSGGGARNAVKAVSSLKKILPSWKRIAIDIEHIASGHIRGGSRVSSLKSLFPSYLNKQQVSRLVRNAYRNVNKKIATQGERVLVQGESQGVKVEMWINKTTKTIETAYPIN